ncbi:MAG: hypothetical protein KDK23_06770 [Leptospiraceae bacterium]|nr:hypothetical protein [Leptospiraceae bacterium]
MKLRSRGAKILSHPVYNLFSAILTSAGILLLMGTALADLKLSTASLLKRLDLILLSFFALETLLRALFQGRDYLRNEFLLDIWALLPLPFLMAGRFLDLGDQPAGFLLFEGGRFLRLVPTMNYFLRQSQAGLRPDGSGTLNGVSLRISLVAFIFLFLGGLATSRLHSRMIESETTARTETVRRYADTEGIQRLPFLIPEWIIGVEKTDAEGAFEIYNIPKSKLAARDGEDTVTYRQNRDYLYIPGPEPGESIYLNLKDLHRRQKLLEIMILLTGLIMISALLLITQSYLRKTVVRPLEHGRRVNELRLAGEEIEEADDLPNNEIGDFIAQADRLYEEMKAPARSPDPSIS